jgi:hypothetical protein
MLEWSQRRRRGRAELAPPGVHDPTGDGLAGKGLGIMRMVVFSEGRGLRARIAMPCASRGTSSLRTSWREAGCQAETCLGCTQAIFAGVRSPPLRGGPSPWYPALRDETPKMRGKWFSRRDALCASANTDPMQTGASRGYGRPGASQVAKSRQFSAWRYASFAGVRSPPLPDADAPKSDGLAGKGPRIGGWRFFRRGAVSASAWYGRTQGEAYHDHQGQRNAGWPNGAIPW